MELGPFWDQSPETQKALVQEMEYGTAEYWEAMFKALWNSLPDEQKFNAKATEAMGKVIDMGKKKGGRKC